MEATLTQYLNQYLADLKHQGLYRSRKINEPSFIDFTRNDYLSLSNDPCLREAFQKGFKAHPIGAGGSMVVCGYHPTHQALERAFAKALAVDDCLLFPSGYTANLSVMGLLARLKAHVLIDKRVHASIYDGIDVYKLPFSRYLHNDMNDLGSKLKTQPSNTVLVTEGIFSMSGQSAPLSDIARLGEKKTQGLIVDEAHAFGLLGQEGLGATILHGLTQEQVPLRVIPLGKACAASGALVAGQGEWVDALLQAARPYIYSTGVSPAFCYGLLKTLDMIRGADDRRAKLYGLVQYFRDSIIHSPLRWRDSSSPIQQLQLGHPELALHFTEKLWEQGIVCSPMREPTVSKQETGLRIMLNYDHEFEHVDYLMTCLHRL